VAPGGVNRNLIVNREVPPFDKPELRHAMALSLDRKAFIDIISEGQGDIGGVMQPQPEGLWGMPPDLLKTLPGYDTDVSHNRGQARQIMEKLGYGLTNRLKVKVSTRDLPFFRDPAVILIDQFNNPRNPTRRNARSWCGRSNEDWQRTARDRLSFITAARPVGSRM
jgi:peptide/nickel transport system substrate-binding protein